MTFVHLITCGAIIYILQIISAAPSVTINGQQIEGFQVKAVNHYLGIPYAQPPIGPLRYRKPQPVQTNQYPTKATKNPPACPQFTEYPYPWYINSTQPKSEDCLYLNVFTPVDASPSKKKAVMYWMHGGGFRYGSIRDELYSGIPLVTMGDIIVVTVNYRIGALGFFSFLTAGEDAVPNLGLHDVLEGLKWVNKNIEAFGGDVQRITIAGESAGSIFAGDLAISPLAEGLYTRIIMESFSPVAPLYGNLGTNDILAQSLANKVGCGGLIPIALRAKEVIECLRGVDADVLVRAEYDILPTPTISFLPQFGDEFLPAQPQNAVFKGKFRCKDLLIGNVHDEGSFGLTTFFPSIYGFFGHEHNHINITLAQNLLKELLGDLFLHLGENIDHLLQSVIPTGLLEGAHDAIRKQLYALLGDVMVICPDEYFGEKCAEQGNNVYSYFFTHRPSISQWAKWMGVAHFEEVQFVFGKPILHPELYKKSEVILSRQMIRFWTNFVKTGKPDNTWPLFSRKDRRFRYLGPKTYTGREGVGPNPVTCDVLRVPFKVL